MQQLICKICGNQLTEIKKGVYKCSACLSIFTESEDKSKYSDRIEKAYELIRKGEFAEAESACSAIIKEDKTVHEAYWARALAKNGVIFVKDIGGEIVPTCQNISGDSFIDNADAVKAIELAPDDVAASYKSQAERIESIRKEWFNTASKEKPYDVFISFKDSDRENGIARTKDSEYAQDLYNYLQEKGLRVFFSRVSLMGKVSDHYEPYIYGALMSAKVMVVYGEKAEYFNSTWIRNEWSRYILRMQRENMPASSLIVAYKGVDPYAIPTALTGGRQALDMSKPSAFNTLVEHIIDTVARASKVVTLQRKEIKGGNIAKRATQIKQNEIKTRAIGATQMQKVDASLESQISMLKDYVSQRLWDIAEEKRLALSEKLPTNGDVMLCELLIRLHCTKIKELTHLTEFNELPLALSVLDNASKPVATDLLEALYSMRNIGNKQYFNVLKSILPYDFPGRDERIKNLFDDAIKNVNEDMFSLLIGTLESSEVEEYISLNERMAEAALGARQYAVAIKHLDNILSVDEGNVNVLRARCELILSGLDFYGTHGAANSGISNLSSFVPAFENLLKYASDANQCVVYFIDKILEDGVVTKIESSILKSILKYYQGDLHSLEDRLLKVVSFLLERELFDDADYFVRIILEENDKCTGAWLALCLIDTKSSTLDKVTESEVPLDKCNGYEKYYELANSAQRKKLVQIIGAQQLHLKELEEKRLAFEREQRILREKQLEEQRRAEEREFQQHQREQQQRLKKEKRQKLIKRMAIICTPVAIIAVTLAMLTVFLFTPMLKYKKASELISKGDYSGAQAIYSDLNGYKDSKTKITVLSAIDKIETLHNVDAGVREILLVGVPVTINYSLAEGGRLTAESAPKNTAKTQVGKAAQADADSAVTTVVYNTSSDFRKLETPERGGYTFERWISTACKYDLSGEKDMVYIDLKPVWTVKQFSISYDLAGGVATGNVNAYDITDAEITLKNPVKSGYTFIGWTGTDLSEPMYTVKIPAGSTGDRSYTANWQANEYKVTYNANGGTASKTSDTATYGSTFTLATAQRAGYKFEGWYLDGEKFEGGVWQILDDVTLVAKWSVITYNIVYHLDGGENHIANPVSYNVNSAALVVNEPAKTGYTFTGWTYDGQTEPQKQLTIPTGSTGAKTYTANWVANKYTITYDPDCGASFIDSVDIEYNQEYTLPEVTKDGYTLLGWYDSDDTLYEGGVWQTDGNVTLVAKWRANKFTITYNDTVGAVVVTLDYNYSGAQSKDITVINGTKLAYPEVPTRSGYVFGGWYTDAETSDLFDFGAAEISNNTTLYAKWVAPSYTYQDVARLDRKNELVFVKGSTADQLYPFVALVSGSLTFYTTGDVSTYGRLYSSTKSTLVYGGTGGSGNNFSLKYSVTAGNLYYVCVSQSKYTTDDVRVQLHFSGATVPTSDITAKNGTACTYKAGSHFTVEVEYGSQVDLPVYENTGAAVRWYWGDRQISSGLWNITENVTLSPVWQPKTYTITYDANGGTCDIDSDTATYGSMFTLATPVREGYTFAGWYSGGKQYTSGVWEDTGDITLKANWQANKYKVTYKGVPKDSAFVTFDYNYEGARSTTVEVANGSTLAYPSTPYREGYIFAGWSAYSSGYSTYSFSGEITGDITLYAKWVKPVYDYVRALDLNVSYVAYAIDVSSTEQLYAFVPLVSTTLTFYTTGSISAGAKLYDSSKTQLTYKSSGSTSSYSMKYSVTAGSVYYIGLYTYSSSGSIRLEISGTTRPTSTAIANVVTDADATYSVEYGSEYTLKEIQKTGYTFDGWYSGKQKIESGIWSIAEDVELEAAWTLTTCTITYDGNGGTSKKQSDIVTFGQNYELAEVEQRPGFSFLGWFNGGEQYTNGVWNKTQNVTLVARWGIINYTITYNLDGGTNHAENPASYTVNSADIDIGEPTKTGYTFVGWTYDGQTTPTKIITIPQGSIGEKNYTANWQANTYTVTYDGNGVTPSKESEVVAFGSAFTLPAVEKVGYTLEGWYNGSEKFNSDIWQITANVTLTAKWVANTNTPYKVEHYQQNVGDSGYTLFETENLTGTSDESVSVEVNKDANFYTPTTQTAKIAADGSLVVKYYYDRKVFNVSFVTNGGTAVASDTFIAGSSSISNYSTVREGFTFGGWFMSAALSNAFAIESITSSSAITLYAWWTEESKAQDFVYSGTTYITITNYGGSSTNVQIPAYIGGVPVTNIAQEAFKNNNSIQSITIPYGVTSIERSVFQNCTSLTSITIPDSVTSIGTQVFYMCSALTSINIPDGVTSIGSNMFWGCASLTSINIPDGVTSIGTCAFKDCSKLTSITIPDGMTSIGGSAFSGCSKLTSITIPDGMTSIGYDAFRGCSSLTGITIPDGVTSIGNSAINGERDLSKTQQKTQNKTENSLQMIV